MEGRSARKVAPIKREQKDARPRKGRGFSWFVCRGKTPPNDDEPNADNSFSALEEGDEDDESRVAFLTNYSRVGRKNTREFASSLAKVLRLDRNARFAENVELSLRAAATLWFFGLPLLLGLRNDETSVFYSSPVFNAQACIMFQYTLDKTLGQTIKLSWHGMVGVMYSTLFANALYLYKDTGVQTEAWNDGDFIFSVIVGCLIVCSTLWLDLSINAQIFLLSNFVYDWMVFSNPHQPPPDLGEFFGMQYKKLLFKNVLKAATGCLLAITANLFPYPITAIQSSRNVADNIVEKLGETWATAIRFYFAREKNSYKQAELKAEMVEMNTYIISLQEKLNAAWWESIFISPWRRTILMLRELVECTTQMYELLTHVMSACTHEEFEEGHQVVVDYCEMHVGMTIAAAHDLLHKCCLVANRGGIRGGGFCGRRNNVDIADQDGEFSDPEAELKRSRNLVRTRVQKLTRAFKQMKLDLASPLVSLDIIDEHIFMKTVCGFSDRACSYADDLLLEARSARGECDEDGRPIASPFKGQGNRIKCFNIFDRKMLFDWDHLNYTFRNSVSIISCWFIGLVGYSKMIKNYDAVIACTASVLLSKFSGSATSKNLGRIQGVVLGLVSGELVYALLGWCEIWAYVSISVLLILWVVATMYVHHSSTKFGYIACLAGAFGTKDFLRGCSDEVVDPAEGFYQIISSVIAIFTMSAVDACSTKRPSSLALKALTDTWDGIQENARKLFDPKLWSSPDSSDMLKEILKMTALADEAKDEPRYWRVPWRSHLFVKATSCVHDMRLNLNCLENTIAKDGAKGAEKEGWFMRLINMSSFQVVIAELEAKMQQTRMLLDIFAHDDVSRFKVLDHDLVQREVIHDISEVIADVNSAKTLSDSNINVCENLEDDTAAQTCFVLVCLRLMMESMHDFQQAVLANAI